ncbi:MAG: glycosyltransferase [Tissierellia bacterium]|nr:glycosyltransferase [Tissierellia bacterium]
MRKILILANQFPPMGGAGVQRTSKFVKYLSQLGHEIQVVTKEFVGGLEDKTLSEDLPQGLKVHRLPAHDLENAQGLLRIPKKVLAKFLSPDSEIFWAKKNEEAIKKIVEDFKPEVIYTTSYPYSAHLLGYRLKKAFPHIFWIADYRDEWTNNPFHLDSAWRRQKLKKEKALELKINGAVDYFITNTPLMLKNFIQDTPSLAEKSVVIPNGYDEDDFQGIDQTMDQSPKFILTHTGSLYGRRNLEEILEAISYLDREGILSKDHFELRIVGNVYERVLEDYRQKYQLEDQLVGYGYLAHRDSIRMLFRSQALLLLIGKGKGSGNFYTGKVFEYLRAHRPILAIVPEGVAKDLIQETGTGLCADPSDTPAIARALKTLYDQRMEAYKPDLEEIHKYDRKRQAQVLSRIIENL